ncbi:DnaD domain-containing protein [Lacticaseibacillus daqingensis]|uniref:DnaD domain-containing protein n=1 Tax=Lacticaseibacillus daqingensis TaxID=2486014 RepID=UPI000F782A22|nr:DnaD domain protein [Lacticaseibacillus daqingensis]
MDLTDYLQAGTTSVSDALFAHFAETALTHQEFVVYLFLTQWTQHHRETPDLAVLAKATKLRPQEVFTVIQNLITKQAIQLVSQKDSSGRTVDHYDVTPLLAQVLTPVNQTTVTATETVGQAVFSQIEVEFGRPLSPIEQQTIHDWLTVDHYAPEMIQLALREAVLNRVYSLRYMDRILIDWEKRHLTTPAAVQEEKTRHLGL